MPAIWKSLAAVLIATEATAAGAAGIPPTALQYRADLIRSSRAVAGIDAPVALFAAQVHQESGWRSAVRSPVGAQGLAQFMPATATWISGLFPELAANDPFNPGWALRAMVTYDVWLSDRIRASSACERWAFALSAYNGGLGWVNKDQALASSKGLDALVWFGSVEQVNSGRSMANWRENRDYPRRIIYVHQPLYTSAGWGPGVCQ